VDEGGKVLTDYHTHLRPDDLDATAARYFNEDNVTEYVKRAIAHGISDLGFSEHVYRFRQSLAIWRHPFWEQCALDDLDAYCDFVLDMKRAGHPVKLGLEVDWVRGREQQISRLISERPFDYIIGSVHFISDHAVDHDGYDAWRQSNPDQVWSDYFGALGEAAASGLFDIIAHPDLVKVWGAERPLPSREPRAFYELAVDQIAGADVAIEVSTAGLRKPVGEIYPARELLDMVVAAGKPVALSSDAHEPHLVGYAYASAIEYLRSAGVDELATFTQRRRTQEPLG
jgi:histidinol-phosphatase (PHP family)